MRDEMPDSDAIPEDRPRVPWRAVGGPFITAVVVALLLGLGAMGVVLPNPGLPLILAVVYAAYSGGLAIGAVAAGIALGYLVWSSAAADGALDGVDELRIATFVIAAAVAIVGGEFVRRRVAAAARGELRREQEFSRALVEAMQDGLNVVRAGDRRIMEVNPRLCELTGYDRDELVGQVPPYTYWPPDEHARMLETLDRAERGESNEIDVSLVRKDGTRVMVIVARAPLRDADGRITGTVTTVKDATERSRAAAALRESEDRYRVVTETASDAIVSIDESSTILFANRAAERIFGYPPAELAGQPLAVLMPPEHVEGHRRGITRYVETGVRRIAWEGIELEAVHRDGSRIPIEISFGEATHDGKRIFTGIIRDVRERIAAREELRRSQEQLDQAQRMQAVGRLAGGIAHDFNNLLTAITGYADLLLSDLPPGSPHRPDVQEIRRTADRATGLTRQLLAFSRRQVLEPKVLDLNRIVADLEPMLQRLISEEIQLVTVLEPRLHRVHADPGQLEQVVLNLCVNARDAMPRGGLLTIQTSNTVVGEAPASGDGGLEPGRYVVLAVSDTGDGMDAETRTHLFEPFYTTKDHGKGTGLGLATVYGIVTQSGGSITVDSQAGQGSTFTIFLPDASAELSETVVEEPAPRSLGGSETVLLVEDDRGVRTLARQVLQRQGYTVLEAATPSEALMTAARHEGSIDLLLSDVVMPEMTGPELARRVRDVVPGIRVVFMSGYADDAFARDSGADPAADFLSKPFGPETLARKIRLALDARDASASATAASPVTPAD
jgi:two-component system, cell cycle sensor histidine kinase and response regulator CckA